MKNSILRIVLSLTLILFFSCKNKSQTDIHGIKTKSSYTQLKKAEWFIGSWKNNTKDMNFVENWKIESDSSYSAESFVLVSKDTVFYESVNLIQKNDSLFYIVSVRNQNNEKPVSFYLTKSNNNQLVFENPKHDFPNKIVYNKINNDSMVATIEGIKNGKKQNEAFPMKRKK